MSKWTQEEIDVLISLYGANNVPSDELIKDQSALSAFINEFNKRSKNANRSSKEIADKLLNLRKSGQLPRLRR